MSNCSTNAFLRLFQVCQPDKHVKWPSLFDVMPEGSCRSARIEHFTITPRQAQMSMLRDMINGRYSEIVSGRYARLFVDGELMMSDTPMEKRTNSSLIVYARGHVLIAGLGLGMVIWPLLAKKPAIRSLLILEKNPDVIELVASNLPKDRRLQIVKADVFKWKPSEKMPKFDTIYFDIWPDIQKSNLAEASKLHARARPWRAIDGWIGDWNTEVCRKRSES